MTGKRSADAIEDGNHAYLKRQKLGTVANYSAMTEIHQSQVPAVEINTGKQLRQLLAFNQDLNQSRSAINSFKTFLGGFVDTDSNSGRRVAILKDYLDSHKPDEDNDAAGHLPEIMQTWDFAYVSGSSDHLASAVPAVLALLLKTISPILELSEHGLRICKTILQKNQLKLISHGLDANKSKEFLISPVLRLLKEIVTFDGGALAKQIYRTRDHTMKSLVRNLNLRFSGDGLEDVKKPSVRTNALRFILSTLKFLPTEAKRDLMLNQRQVFMAITNVKLDDPSFMLREILSMLKTQVLQDEALPRDAKTKVVNATSLKRIATLYDYDQPEADTSTPPEAIDLAAHNFLLLACTSHDIGILNRQTGFYPKGVDPDDLHDVDAENGLLDLGLENIEWMHSFTNEVPVRNTILSELIQCLRPWSSIKQKELLISILRSAPELVAEYFFTRRSFSFDPKLTATWIGYSAFIFATLQIPVPKYLGHQERYSKLPPPPSVVLESVLPQPLSQKVLRSCLIHDQSLIKFFAVRLLCISLRKLQEILKMYHEAVEAGSSLWTQGIVVLTEEFCKRCPSIKDVFLAFRNMSDEDCLQKEAITKLLVLYYEVVPALALEAKCDVSGALTKALQGIEDISLRQENRGLRTLELENLFQFAHFSPEMRWFAKPKDLTSSPFMAMLRLAAEAPLDVQLTKMKSVLDSVVEESQILQTQTQVSALDSLILRLRDLPMSKSTSTVYAFLDDCISRCAANPVKYIFALEVLQSKLETSDKKQAPFSLLTMTIAEQWPFVVKSGDKKDVKEVAQFIAQFIATCIKIKENKNAMKIVIENMVANMETEAPGRKTIERARKLVEEIVAAEPRPKASKKSDKSTKSNGPSKAEKSAITTTMLDDYSPLVEDPTSLTRWSAKDVEEVIEGGILASLVKLLSSQHLHIRREATTNLLKFASKLKESSFSEAEQIWLLLCEVVETAKKTIDQSPLPTIIAIFASQAINVLNDPLHVLYPKINKFLSQGPTWNIDRIPLMYKILDESPSLDDAYYPEISWLLNYMLAGLRTEADMAVFRNRRVFEKLFSLWNNAYLAPGLRDKILRILYRATTIEGGSTTLITRFSTMTWLQAQVALGAGTSLKVLMERIIETSDKKRVGKWAKGLDVVKANTMEF
ncbi:ribosome 60S biogenesis N-terminal-domain-containing protein [Amylocarpus encephaloides]|uniref:Ribosome 60S biogenesis N-terminal-domain-containing protein n=1 Tax=Amylocarpus encephaloides TaxID=45428 RepID=A0A9P8C953_9HELO|nr:ribosome 60S biogenesis N-terminal-domain-containing protein [Amylocarpus encephaloides]